MKLGYSFFVIPLILGGAALGGTGCSGTLKGGASSPGGFEFGAVTQGVLERTVSSSGTLQPVSTVSVLSQMNGKVDRIYVDFNDTIRQGDTLAILNTDTLKLQREQQMAQVIKARANYELQELNYRNLERLAEKNLIPEYELKTGKTNLAIQRADLAAAEASLKVIETEINQYAFITSPIDGIVLERTITAGSTVTGGSSANPSSLFTLAENLEEMRIEASVGELDVSGIHQGQEVRFTLEALPGKTYTGVVDSLHLVPTTVNNVVSYTVIIDVENRDGSLLPGMTCAVEFILERRENILMVPNAALRFQPRNLSAEEISDLVFNAGLQGMTEEQREAAIKARTEAAQAQPGSAQAGSSSGMGLAGLVSAPAMGGRGPGGPGGPGGGGAPPMGGGPSSGGGGSASGRSGTGRAAGAPVIKNLWYLNGEGKPEVILVRTGITNGSFTEVRPMGGNLEGTRIIVREKI